MINMDRMKCVNRIDSSDWSNPFGLALVSYYIVMAIVGLLIPDDILTRHMWAREFSDFMAGIVPQINRITALGIKPDVNRFYFAILWASSPVLLLISLALVLDGRHRNYAMWSMPFPRALVGITACLAILVCAQWLYWMDDSTNRQVRLLFGNSLGMSLWASVIYVHGAVCFGAGFLVWVSAWSCGYIPQRIKEHGNV